MEDNNLVKILKCDVPDVELDSKKILYNCKNHKNRIKLNYSVDNSPTKVLRYYGRMGRASVVQR